MSSKIEEEKPFEEEEEEIIDKRPYDHIIHKNISEIEQAAEEDYIGSHRTGFDSRTDTEDHVYVVIRAGGNHDYSCNDEEYRSSMDALVWTLAHVFNPSSTLVFLVHVFPEIKHIPCPLGMIPVSQVNPEQKYKYMASLTSKRRDFLNKFLTVCSASKIKADTVLIESDTEKHAITELIPILNITRLVLGTTPKAGNLRKTRTKKGRATIAEEIAKCAPEYCEVKIISKGREVVDHHLSPSPFNSQTPAVYTEASRSVDRAGDDATANFACLCFKPKM